MMRARVTFRVVAVAGFVLSSALLCVAAFSASAWRTAYVYLPRERAVENAIRQAAEAERRVYETTGEFAGFAHSAMESDPGPIGLPWHTFPVNEFYFDAVTLESGHLRLRALPRPEAVQKLHIRARAFVSELSPEGEIVHSGWLPPRGQTP